ncbi:LuxR C-terminal-related transcriptional regulator [Rugamonas apoptosis]|uniref:Helix-turn-helix transcriptional regulator n=1 Tax=Rugamonas apoptosis TaxID=2758570 RepID=A0A7W2IKJ5_9BURK|nr:LuxR C-terminal-related transcriptional regulator [Rugamonas apoptosis]MBA5687870.1 helix-turn-helix transcriptional regulator [Rugamonas apoptosis]
MNQAASVAPNRLAAKLNPPSAPAAQVLRKAVAGAVRAAQSVRLVLVRAPAGFGKTTTMLQCRAQFEADGVETLWLTLDRGDNDPARFLACLGAAVAQLHGEQAAAGDGALDIMERLAAHPSPFALFFDDFEHVTDPTVLDLVRELIANLPRRGQLVIGARSRPDLGLGRLRARGQLLEIDTTQLRFSADEAAEFITGQRHIALGEADLAALYRKTEGWAAALWLASMALERQEGRADFIARFSGSNDAVADYLADDVLARQSDTVRDFLLRTAILRHLNASLCDALLGRDDSAQLLAALEQANLFIQPIEGEPGTYRYHSLFAGFLRQQLRITMPGEEQRLHRAASDWYQAQGAIVPAIDHALDGGKLELALRLLQQHAEALLEEGRMHLLTRWFGAIPPAALAQAPMLVVVKTWALALSRGPREAMAVLDASGCADSTDPDVRAHLLALRPSLLTMMDRIEEACTAGMDALAQLPLSRPFAESMVINGMALILCSLGQYQQSHQMLDTARRKQGDGAGIFNRMYSESIEGILDLEGGRLRQASARFRLAVNTTHAPSYTHTHGNAFAGVLYADALYEANELRTAAHLFNVYVPLAKDVALADHMIIGYTRQARIAFTRGDIDMMLQYLSELEYTGYQRQLPRVVASAKLERSRMLLLQGNRVAAREELERANDTAVWSRVRGLRLLAHDVEQFDLGRLRWEAHFGPSASALEQIDAALAEAASEGRVRRQLKLQLLRAICLHHGGQGQSRVAQTAMLQALREASGEGFVRLIVDEGPVAGLLVRRVRDGLRADAAARPDPLFGDYLLRLTQAFPPAEVETEAETVAETGAGAALAEPLTQKETRILALLADGYSNSALAEKLFVSDSTVRTHLRNINTKLHAQSRTQAVAIARRLGIIA